jgi:hypothetical protein
VVLNGILSIGHIVDERPAVRNGANRWVSNKMQTVSTPKPTPRFAIFFPGVEPTDTHTD